MTTHQQIPELIQINNFSDSEYGAKTLDSIVENKLINGSTNGAYSQVKTGSISSKVLVLAGGMMGAVFTPSNVLGQQIVLIDQSNEQSLKEYLETVDKQLDAYLNKISGLNCKPIRRDLINAINSFTEMEEDWDGYGANPLGAASAANAIALVEKLGKSSLNKISLVYPNSNSTVSVKWDNGMGEKVSLEVGSKTFSYYIKLNSYPKPKFFNNVQINTETVNQLDQHISCL
ncbi:hypothetical protein [Spirosoma endophyticum]|uniref:Uncharacterized protein n=1 Tax=Spirosoma endophyticum TaxID=662367 RepID=A0A1I1SIE0_9BACT|nr:hypothetical protein [Spirosoma endophyticum]SFD46249.1 hypothetical protein SAMN05216167_105122 [Spirosoma endophyticum]